VRLPGAGTLGAILLALIALPCFLTLPWTLGWLGPETAPAPYKRALLDANLLPPAFQAPAEDEADRRTALESAELALPMHDALGTDTLGRSLLARLLTGGAVSLGIGIAAAAIAVVIGTLYGAIAGYAGGRTDAVMMRIVDILYGLPYILLVVLLAVAVDALLQGAALSEEQRVAVNVLTLLVAIGGVSWLTMARVVRGQVLSLREQPFIEAARAAGAPPRRLFLVHLLPNLLGPIIVYGALTAPQAILQESFLSFLGIGVQPPLPSWGNLAAAGLGELNTVRPRWWLLVFPSILLAITLLALNFLGEGLRERLDPRRSAQRSSASA
jgi:oligopeptide transport system permease protein